MPKKRPRSTRYRVGRVSYYLHHGAWWIYYRDGQRPVRQRIADANPNGRSDAERVAAQINAQLSSAAPALLSFQPIGVEELREKFLEHHEQVRRSSVSTVRRYRAATGHLIDFARRLNRPLQAHELPVEQFVAFLRSREVSPNGHPHTPKRRLRDKGVRYVLEVCRSMYGYAQRKRHLPPYAPNPFAELQIDRMQVEDAKPIFVFTAETELAFFQAADVWSLPLHFTLAKTGLRPGELTHLLIEDVELGGRNGGWLHVRNKPELGWQVKTRAQRDIPLIKELQDLLRHVIGSRTAGPVFLRPRFRGGERPPLVLDRRGLARILQERLGGEAARRGSELSREDRLRVARGLWRDAGAVKVDSVRNSFLRITRSIGRPEATCPKSWRHTFATLLQDAGVDPLIRQITIGHQPAGAGGALGMTGVYTHTRAATWRREIERALRLWPHSLQYIQDWLQAQGGAS